MAPPHRVGDIRACGAVTVGTGLNTKVMIENQLAAVQGDVNSHNMLGQLVSVASGMAGKQIMVQGIPMIVAMIDQAAPDVMGTIPHVQNFPTPMTGATKVQAYGMLGGFGGGLGSILQGFGNLNIGELVSVAGQVVGQIHNFTNVGGNNGLLILKNIQGAGLGSLSGQVLTGQTSNNKFVMSNYTTTLDPSNLIYVYDENGNPVVEESGDRVTL